MKCRTLSILGVVLALATSVPMVHAQRTGFAVGIAPPAQGPVGPVFSMQPFRTQTVISSPILPMSNPIQPILPNPYIPYGPVQQFAPPTIIVVPSQPHSPRPIPPTSDFSYSGNDRRGPDVTIIAPNSTVIVPATYAQPYGYASPVPTVQTTPFIPIPATVQQPVVVQPVPRQPRPVVVPPPIGASRADVLLLLGKPIGTIGRPSIETLYFESGMIVVLQGGQVIQIK